MTHTVYLDINRSKIGAYRASRIFMACRSYVQRLCQTRAQVSQAVYRDYERVGWYFYTQTERQAILLCEYYADVMRKTAGWQID